MPSLISRLNCFSKKRSGNNHKREETDEEDNAVDGSGDQYDDVQKLLLAPTRSASNSTSPSSKLGSSESSKGSRRSKPSTLSPKISAKQHNPYDNDDNSIPTMDSDYKQVNAGNFSLSDAGGTINTQNQSLTNFSQAASAFGSMAPSAYGGTGASVGGHDYYRDTTMSPSQRYLQQQRDHRPREEFLEIHAPAGKLGLVIDTPATSATPVVHAIKDTCPIRSEIYVGDKLVAVDDVDVREMSAVAVSKLISNRSGQETRKLTIVRTARGRDGMY